MVKGVPTAVQVETKTPSHEIGEYDSRKYDRRRKIVIGLSIGMILIIVVPLILWGVFGFINYAYIGSYTYDETSMDYTNLNLIVDNNVGSIDVYYEGSLTKPFEATVDLYGRKGASLLDAENFTTAYLTNDTVEISFNSGDFDFFFWNKKVFTYDISIYINPLVTADVFIDADTGSVSFSTEGLDSIEIVNLDMSSNTGSIDLDLVNSVNTTLNGLNLKGNTGRILVDLGTRTALKDSNVLIDTDTGIIDFEFVDLIAYDDMTWEITTDTGSIEVSITQNIVYPFAFVSDFLIDTDTGSVSVDFLFNATIGYTFSSSSSTGSVDILGSENDYTSPNYMTATNLYDFNLSTSTGSVTVTEM